MKEILLKGTWLIKAPRDQVYAMISDFEAMPLNFPKVARSVRIAARDGNRLTIHARAASFGSIFPDVNVVMATELLPLRGFISDNVNDTLGTAGHEEFMLRDAPGGTLIDYSYRITIRRAWLRLLAGPLVRWLVVIALLLGAHFALTAIAPGEKPLLYWPFAKDSRPTLDILGPAARPVTQLLSVLAGSCFLASVLAILGWLVPPAWFTPLVIIGAAASGLLFLLYIGIHAVIPLAIDAFLLWGIFGSRWTVAALRGA